MCSTVHVTPSVFHHFCLYRNYSGPVPPRDLQSSWLSLVSDDVSIDTYVHVCAVRYTLHSLYFIFRNFSGPVAPRDLQSSWLSLVSDDVSIDTYVHVCALVHVTPSVFHHFYQQELQRACGATGPAVQLAVPGLRRRVYRYICTCMCSTVHVTLSVFHL